MEKTIVKGKENKWLLFAGVGLWVVGMALGMVFGNRGLHVEEQVFLSMSSSLRWILSFFVFVFAVPCFAEGVFRNWNSQVKFLSLISILCMALAVVVIYVRLSGIWGTVVAVASVVVVALLADLMFLRYKGKEPNIGLFVIGSTFLWVAYYVAHVGRLSPCAVFDIVKLVGLAFVCCYLVINHGLLYAIIAHACNNLVVALPIVLTQCSLDTVRMEQGDTHVTLQRIYTSERVSSITGTSLLLQGSMEEVVSGLARELDGGNKLYACCVEEDPLYYRLEADAKSGLVLDSVLYAMARGGIVRMDTSYEPMWMVDLPKSSLQEGALPSSGEHLSLGNCIRWIRQKYHVPVVLNPEINPELPDAGGLSGSLDERCLSFDDFVRCANASGSVKVSRLPYEKVCVVRICCP